MANKKLSLYEQAIIEEKRRKLKTLKSEYDPKKKYDGQVKALLPNIEWNAKQLKYINAKQFIKWYLGGYKSGKSFTGVAVDIWLAYVNRPYPGILVHPTHDGHKLTIIPLIEEICKLNGIEYEVKNMNSKYKVIFKFGVDKSEWGNLFLVSGDTPKSLKGPKLAFGHIDEPFIMKEEICEVIISRLAEAKGKKRMLQYTGTPEPVHMQWGWDICDEPEADTDKYFKITMSTVEVEKHLPDGYISEMKKNLSAAQIETFVHGKYRNLSQGKVYEEFDRERNVKQIDISTLIDAEIVIGFDFNVNQMSAAMFALEGIWKHQVKEFRIRARSNTREMCQLIIGYLSDNKFIKESGYTRYNKSIIITGDAAGRAKSTKSNKSDYDIILQEFESAGIEVTIYVPQANPAVRDRVNYINNQFDNGTYIIDKECEVTIRDRELTSWKMGADGFFIDKSKKELTHMADAADYALYNTQMLTAGEDGEHSSIETYYRER